MNVRVLLIVFSLLLVPAHAWSQLTVESTEPEIVCTNQQILPFNLDSTATKAALDSFMHEIAGRYELIQIRGGWIPPRKINWVTEMHLSSDGKGFFYDNHKLTLTFTLTLSSHWNFIRCTIQEVGTPLFRLSSHTKGVIRSCDQLLIIDQHIGDGEVFVFKRI